MVTAIRPRTRTLLVDVALAVPLGAVMVGPHYGSPDRAGGPAGAIAFTLIGLAIAALPIRRLLPLVALGTATTASAAHLALGYPDGPIFLAVPVAIYAVAAGHGIRRSLPVCAASAVVLTAADLADSPRWWAESGPVAEWMVVFGLAPWAMGTIIRMERESARAAQAEARRERDYQERLRTAHDVHDIVGHGLAAISMQAGVAMHVLDRSPERAREILMTIKASSGDALDELRSTLAVFRSPDDERAPAPGLDQLGVLVNRTAEAGLPVQLERVGEPGRLPVGVELTAYRIVQEALTNALRHAGPATATVRIGHAPDALTVEVVDTGQGRDNGSSSNGTGDGQGIAGMRGRAAAVGGTLEAGPGPTGGFAVRARLPVAGRP
ncbi:sensor histidine kinase [Qaidamihabitans albus]|uniref:sensor histidine kinase n=1 Tax=Qaidamihabitans albus TaxID=2795733 RepID=UPI0018F233B3|nr:sensor histidine kinase [Qaidamihabitans albus]